MAGRSVSWPDSTVRPSPQGYGAEPIAYWLLGRHSYLAKLLEQAGCVLSRTRRRDPDEVDDIEPLPYEGWPWRPDLETLAARLRVFDEWQQGEIGDAASPPTDAKPLADMTDNDICQLRLLAMLAAEGPEVGLGESGMYALDEPGRAVLADWLEALRLEWADPLWRITGPSH